MNKTDTGSSTNSSSSSNSKMAAGAKPGGEQGNLLLSVWNHYLCQAQTASEKKFQERLTHAAE
jgi:hypothetical protein